MGPSHIHWSVWCLQMVRVITKKVSLSTFSSLSCILEASLDAFVFHRGCQFPGVRREQLSPSPYTGWEILGTSGRPFVINRPWLDYFMNILLLFDWCSLPHYRKENESNYSLCETELLFDLLGTCHLVIFLVWSILASTAKGRQLKDTAGPTGSRETLGTKPGLQSWEKTPQSERAKSDLAEKATTSVEHSQASVSASAENLRAFVQNMTSRGQ